MSTSPCQRAQESQRPVTTQSLSEEVWGVAQRSASGYFPADVDAAPWTTL